MRQEVYQQQITRLAKNWGEHNYKAERASLFWKAFNSVADDVFEAAVDLLIAEQRTAPMLKEISAAVERAKVTANSARMAGNAFANVLGELIDKNQAAHPEHIGACIELFKKRYCERDPAKRYSPEQFAQGLEYLEELEKQFNPGQRGGKGSYTPLRVKNEGSRE
jgi:hypothetical protein